MHDRQLVEAVKSLLVFPSSEETPYNLSKPNVTHFSQNGQDAFIEKVFGGKVRSSCAGYY